MRIRDVRFSKVYVAGHRAQRNHNTYQAKHGVGHGAEDGKTKRRAVAHQWEITLHRHVMIEPNSGDRNQREDRGCNTGSDHPGWERSVDEALHPRPAREQRVAPESDACQMIAVHRSTNYFGNNVIGRAEADPAEPEKEQIIRVPPADSRWQYSLHRDDEKHYLAAAYSHGNQRNAPSKYHCEM